MRVYTATNLFWGISVNTIDLQADDSGSHALQHTYICIRTLIRGLKPRVKVSPACHTRARLMAGKLRCRLLGIKLTADD